MRVLLDTHALFWALEGNPRLSRHAAEVLGDENNEIVVSAVSGYEICLKYAIGKLPGAQWLATDFLRVMDEAEFEPLPVTLEHAVVAGSLAIPHKDPFDRLLIAQAQVEQLVLVSNEALFDQFGVRRLW